MKPPILDLFFIHYQKLEENKKIKFNNDKKAIQNKNKNKNKTKTKTKEKDKRSPSSVICVAVREEILFVNIDPVIFFDF